jgi:hypothetical protein
MCLPKLSNLANCVPGSFPTVWWLFYVGPKPNSASSFSLSSSNGSCTIYWFVGLRDHLFLLLVSSNDCTGPIASWAKEIDILSLVCAPIESINSTSLSIFNRVKPSILHTTHFQRFPLSWRIFNTVKPCSITTVGKQQTTKGAHSHFMLLIIKHLNLEPSRYDATSCPFLKLI